MPPLPFPVITGMPSDPVEDGTEISLRCSAETTDPDAQLFWYRKGNKVPQTSYNIEVSITYSP